MSITIIDVVSYRGRYEELEVLEGVFSSHEPGVRPSIDCFSFIVYSRFINRPVTVVAIQTYYRPFSLLLLRRKEPGPYTPRIRVGNGLSCAALERPDATV